MAAGLIGCEFANDLTHGGMAVSVGHGAGVLALEPLRPGARGWRLERGLAELGVPWSLGRVVQSLDDGRLLGFALSGEAVADKNTLTRELPPTLP